MDRRLPRRPRLHRADLGPGSRGRLDPRPGFNSPASTHTPREGTQKGCPAVAVIVVVLGLVEPSAISTSVPGRKRLNSHVPHWICVRTSSFAASSGSDLASSAARRVALCAGRLACEGLGLALGWLLRFGRGFGRAAAFRALHAWPQHACLGARLRSCPALCRRPLVPRREQGGPGWSALLLSSAPAAGRRSRRSPDTGRAALPTGPTAGRQRLHRGTSAPAAGVLKSRRNGPGPAVHAGPGLPLSERFPARKPRIR